MNANDYQDPIGSEPPISYPPVTPGSLLDPVLQGQKLVLHTKPKMPRHPSLLWGREEREARWRRCGVLELSKEIASWKPGAVSQELVDHAMTFLATLEAEHAAKYLHGKLT